MKKAEVKVLAQKYVVSAFHVHLFGGPNPAHLIEGTD